MRWIKKLFPDYDRGWDDGWKAAKEDSKEDESARMFEPTELGKIYQELSLLRGQIDAARALGRREILFPLQEEIKAQDRELIRQAWDLLQEKKRGEDADKES